MPVAGSKDSGELRRANAIAELAEHIAMDRFGGERVSPEEIADAEGISFRYDTFPEEFDGILLYESGKFMIVCNERRGVRGSTRSRFTFAHELGHYFIDEHRQALTSGKMPLHFSLAEFVSDQPVEKQADLFAANLLMPGAAFRKKAADLDCGMNAVSWLSSVYGTSLTATGYRALQLDTMPAPSALFRWKRDGSLAGHRLSLTTFTMHPGYRSMTNKIPKGSVTEKAAARFDIGVSKGITDCAQWFPWVQPGDVRNVTLVEETMGIGQFGWITLLYRKTLG